MVADQEEPPGRHAGGRTIEAQAERQRCDSTIEFGSGQNEDRIAARQFHDGGCQMVRELMQNRCTGCGGTGEKHLIHAGSDRVARSLGGFVEQLQQRGIEAAPY